MSHKPYRCGDCRRDSIANPEWFTNMVKKYNGMLLKYGETGDGFIVFYCGCRGWD